jgi:DNA polymerase-3 subunit delta'
MENIPAWIQSQQTVLGHDAVTHAFTQALQKNRLHHAWLLCGPKGIGKATLAHLLSRHLFRGGLEFHQPEPEDRIYHACISGGHPDLFILHKDKDPEAKKTISIQQVRETSKFIHQTAAHNGWRIVIIDALDDMNDKAANALLKDLEEPGEKTIYFLICHNLHGILPTIKSRCRQVQLHPIHKEIIAQHLDQNHPELSPKEQAFYTTVSEGRFGLLNQLIDQEAYSIAQDFLTAIFESHQNPNQTPWSVMKCIQNYGSAKNEEDYKVFEYLYPWWLSQHTKALSLQNPSLLENLPDPAQQLYELQGFDAAYWAQHYEEFLEITAADKVFNLDRRAILMGALE